MTATTRYLLILLALAAIGVLLRLEDDSLDKNIETVDVVMDDKTKRTIYYYEDDSTTSSSSGTAPVVVRHENASSTSSSPLPHSENRCSHDGCWRPCNNDYNNKIVLYPSVAHKGGLADRAIVFANLLHIAGYLCATAYVPSPAALLSKGHARGDDFAAIANTMWSDFLDVRMLASNRSDLLVTLPNDFNDESSIESLFPPNDGEHDDVDWMYITTTRVQDIGRDFDLVEAVSWRKSDDKSHFVWGIHTTGPNFFEWNKLLRNHLRKRMNNTNTLNNNNNNMSEETTATSSSTTSSNRTAAAMLPRAIRSTDGCAYSAVYPPSHVQAAADRVMDRVKNQLHSLAKKNNSLVSSDNGNDDFGGFLVGYLHIRRGDESDGICKTPLERMEKFLRCSFQNVPYNRTALLFSSDEKDPLYRHRIQEFVERYVGPFFDLDQMAFDAVRQDIRTSNNNASAAVAYRENNYYVYHVINTVAQQTAFQLSQRRHFHCPDCVDLSSIHDLPHEELRLEYYQVPLPPRETASPGC